MVSDELRELYQEYILDHGRNPRNFRVLENPSHEGEGYNPLCGDQVFLKVKVAGGVIEDIGFQGSGCAIHTASASTMTETVMGKSTQEARELFERFHALVTGEDPDPDFEALGKLAVFGGVSEFPMRVKCATLSWHTLNAALSEDGGSGTVTTE